jgi:hypothetical protein
MKPVDLALLRLRVDLDGASPPIWRRLDIRSDTPLSMVHSVLQAAFEWDDCHLYRFSIGGHPFDSMSTHFLCPYEVAEGDEGVPASDVRLGEVMAKPADTLRYLYDYGDSWEVTVLLEKVLSATATSPIATAIDGRRAAPPEDSGGAVDGKSLAKILDEPARFDHGELNAALQGPMIALPSAQVHPQLLAAANQLRDTAMGDDFAQRLLSLSDQPAEPAPDNAGDLLAAHQWFLDRAVTGIPLTTAGYLKPADVVAACEVLPAMLNWPGMNNREVQSLPLLDFRSSLQAVGLLRKRTGSLLLTKAGAAAQRDPSLLWQHLANHLIPAKADPFNTLATRILLLFAATSPDDPNGLADVATTLTELGWTHSDGTHLVSGDLRQLAAFSILANLADPTVAANRHNWLGPVAAALAHAALSN